MSNQAFPRYVPKVGVDLVFTGDHHYHTALVPDEDRHATWDAESLVLTIYLSEYDAKELYWDLLEFIPQLRHDRR